jgi:hypothetical protein
MDSRVRSYACHYQDGRKVQGLSYTESLTAFEYAKKTDNPCSVHPEITHPYKAP